MKSPAVRWGMTVGGCFAALYVATLSRWYSGDSLYFAWRVDSASLPDRIDAHHILLNPACWVWVELWKAAGWTGHSIIPLQVLNAIAGAAAVTFVFLIVARTSGALAAATLASAGSAVAGGLWLFSTEAEDATLGLAPHIAVLALLLQLDATKVRPRTAAGMGVAIAAVALTYAVGIFLLPVAALVVWQGRGANPSWRRSMTVLLGSCALGLLPAVIAVVWIQRVHWWGALYAGYLGGDTYGVLRWDNGPRGMYAALRMLVLFPGLGINDRTTAFWMAANSGQRAVFVLVYVAVAVVAVVPLVLFWRHRREWSLEWRQRFLLWAGMCTIFAFWWVPGDLEFWLPVASGWWILVGLLIGRGVVPPFVAALAIPLLFVVNGSAVIWPHRDETRNQLLHAALDIGQHTSQQDSLITSSALDIFIRYFVGRTTVNIDTEGSVERAVERVRAQAHQSGGRIFLVSVPLDDSARARWQATPAFEAGGIEVVELHP